LIRIEQKKIEGSPQSTEGGEITYYYHDDGNELGSDLVLIIETAYWEMGKQTTSYYYNWYDLWFVYDEKHEYNAPIYMTNDVIIDDPSLEAFDPQKSIIKENRYYFFVENMIKWIDSEWDEIPTFVDYFTDKSKEIQKQANELFVYWSLE